MFNPASTADYATTDSGYYDPDFPPIHIPHVFMSQGKPIQSFLWLANGKEAKGCVILSPQRYGGDCLDSLIPALLGCGINVMRFHPRGMWDDKEEYSFLTALEDLHSAVAFLRENGGQHMVPPGTGPIRPFQINLDRIAVLGKSGGGGMMGWVAGSESPYLNAVITVSPAGLPPKPLPPEFIPFFNDLKASLVGRVDLEKEINCLTPDEYDRLNMFKAASKLVDKNVLLIGQSNREYLKSVHQPLVDAMQSAGAKHFSQAILGPDEYFLTVRIALARLVVSWLKTECGF